MPQLDLQEVTGYVEANIGAFHVKRLQKLENLRLLGVLKRKNPYLFKAKNVLTAEGLVRTVLDAYLSSQEETLFGEFLEGLAVFVCEWVHGGYRPSPGDFTGIDLIFQHGSTLYVVQIKSGPNWGNSDQIVKMLANFDSAKGRLQQANPDLTIVAVNGCSYGRDASPSKRDGRYWKLCGQDFWQLISSDAEFYVRIIEPLGHQAQERNAAFQEAYAAIVNRFTRQFIEDFCKPDFSSDWEKLVRLVSQHEDRSAYPFDG